MLKIAQSHQELGRPAPDVALSLGGLEDLLLPVHHVVEQQGDEPHEEDGQRADAGDVARVVDHVVRRERVEHLESSRSRNLSIAARTKAEKI